MANNGVVNKCARPEMARRVGCILILSSTFVFWDEALSLSEVLANFRRELLNGFRRSFPGDRVKDLS
jgi:hypothetical protein